MLKRHVTLKDVAELAGVSKMAVSAVLSGKKSTVGVSTATRERILAAAEQLEYRPDEFARAMRMRPIGTIGLLYDTGFIHMENTFVTTIINAMSLEVDQHGFDLLLYCGIDVLDTPKLLGRLFNNKIDGLVIAPTGGDTSWIEKLRESRVPIVILGERVSGFDSVMADDERGGGILARHLLSKGHRHILYRGSSIPSSSDELRLAGFQQALAGSGCKLSVTRAKDILDSITIQEEEMLLGREGHDPITAVACWRDRSADRVLSFCINQQIAVPSEIAITGFGATGGQNHQSGRSITTFDPYWWTAMIHAVNFVVAQVNGKDKPNYDDPVKGKLVVGDTS